MSLICEEMWRHAPTTGKAIICELEKSGYEAYFVGGCVRDLFIGKTPHDWDICTNANPDQVKAVFPGYPILDTGIRHGTITLYAGTDDIFEVTTYRVDGEYDKTKREPKEVHWTKNIVEDLSRRDFTMNAIAFNGHEIQDPFNGEKDIESKLIRCVGNPDERFDEDPLRILRAMRFSSTYGFTIDIETSDSMDRQKSSLKRVSMERISSELKKMLSGWNTFNVLMTHKEILFEIIPELRATNDCEQNNPWHIYNVYEHTAHAIEKCETDDPTVRLSLLFHDIGKPVVKRTDETGRDHFTGHAVKSSNMARKIMKRMKFSNDEIYNVTRLILYHDVFYETIDNPRKTVRKVLAALGEVRFMQHLEIRKADVQAQTSEGLDKRLEKIEKIKDIVKDVIRDNDCIHIKDLDVNGNDLMEALNLPAGKIIGSILNHLLDKVIDGSIQNDKESLINEATLYCNEIQKTLSEKCRLNTYNET